jgi:acyl transferase domain-containing protein
LAGGVNALLLPDFFVAFSQLNMLSPTGRCRAFDASADGFVRSEGAGMVLLKPLDQALADQDRIYAVIRGTAVNQDGRTPGMTVPSQEAQEKLVATACRAAEIEPRQIDYVEAHGTGTLVGDPIEARALGRILGEGRSAERPCILGSVKTNIGHLEAGAGVASLMKVALAMFHECIPANLHFQNPNPEIDFGQLGLNVPTAAIPWPRRSQPRWAGINGFGYGGTNVHVILQDAPPGDFRSGYSERRTGRDRDLLESRGNRVPVTRVEKRRNWWRNFRMSMSGPARTDSSFCPIGSGHWRNGGADYRPNSIPLSPQGSFRDWVGNAVHRRSHHDYRLTLVADSFDELKRQLRELSESSAVMAERSCRVAPRTPRVAFVCSGQGPQWWAMGRELLDQEPVFRNMIRRCDTLVQQLGFWSLWDELTASESNHGWPIPPSPSRPSLPSKSPLAEVLQTWGVQPVAVAGHSVGEVAAAYLAGVFSAGRCRPNHLSAGTMHGACFVGMEACSRQV